MLDSMEPIAVDFPLRGEWVAPNTPGYKVPSQGTDQLGQRYAYDLMQIDWTKSKGYKFFNKPLWSYFLFGVAIHDCFGWAQPFYAPFDGEIIEAHDGQKERKRLHIISDLFVLCKNAMFFDPSKVNDLSPVLGNYIILKGKDAFAFFGHARNGSLTVKTGERVSVGQKLAEVGHSGNSMAPHLHFHLMDSPDILSANGIPCCFREYEIYQDEVWKKIFNGIPNRRDRIRVT